jgi:hypothetical protein
MNNKKLVLQIRNANFEDFGGAERYPIFLSKSLERLGYKSVVVSKSPSLLRYAKSENIKTMEGWWWSRQNWSGSRVLLLPVYIVWQITLYFWYLQLFLLTTVFSSSLPPTVTFHDQGPQLSKKLAKLKNQIKTKDSRIIEHQEVATEARDSCLF